ncbi:MAG TPA: hypothetical protein VEB86_19680 [Chryseosolibacter sp.]|nr:hypothetical protein [Chryseosolibacter sp.]
MHRSSNAIESGKTELVDKGYMARIMARIPDIEAAVNLTGDIGWSAAL